MFLIFIDVKKKYIILFIAISLLYLNISAQQYDLYFDNICSKDGLSSGTVTAITQDNEGFLWVGTQNGLNRYDGYQFKIYHNIINQPESLSDNFIRCLFVDSKGLLWIGTDNGGLNVYISEKDNFKSYIHKSSDSNSIKRNRVWDINEDNEGNIWAVTDVSVNKFDKKTQKFTNYTYYNENKRWLPKKIHFDNKNRIWISTWQQGLFFINPTTSEIHEIKYLKEPFNQSSLNINEIKQINDSTWIIGTYGNGAYILKETSNLQFVSYELAFYNELPSNYLNAICIDNQKKAWIGTDYGLYILPSSISDIKSNLEFTGDIKLPDTKILAIFKDRSNVMWIGTQGMGLYKYSPYNKVIRWLNKRNNDIPNNNITAITSDGGNGYWIGTWGNGQGYYDILSNKFFYDKSDICLPNQYIRKLYHHKNNVWIGSNKGLYKLDPEKYKINLIKNSPFAVNNIIPKDESSFWIGTWGSGVYNYNFKYNKWTPLEFNESERKFSPYINRMYKDSNDNLWIGTFNTGFKKYNTHTNTFIDFKYNPNHKSIYESATQNQLIYFEDNHNNIWVGTQDNGLNIINKTTNEITFFPMPVNAIFKQNDTIYWIGTNDGLKKYLYHDNIFINFNTNHGIPGNQIFDITQDKYNNLWLLTNNGLCNFNPLTHAAINYNISDGLQDNALLECKINYHMPSGDILITGPNGINIFNPDSVPENLTKPTILFTDLKIYNQSVSPNETINGNIILTQPISKTTNITLSYKEYAFSISFSSFDYNAPQKNQYKYFLKGIDKDWKFTENNTLTFTALPAGKYTLMVIGSNNNNNWTETPAILNITIKPPFWKSTWFTFGLVTLIIGMIIGRIYNIRNKNKKLQKMVNERTIEINNQKNELQSLNNTKDRIFSIIGHDLKDPFNIISGSSSLLLYKYDTLPDEKIKKLLKIINISSDNAYGLLENLLQWSRINTHKITVQTETFDINTIVNENIELLKGIAEYKEIDIVFEPKTIIVNSDKSLLNTIIRNLITNAIKYSNPKTEIHIQLRETAHDISIFIIDYGIGMDEATIKKLFNPLDRENRKGTQGEPGTGVGLILCKDFIDMLKGKIHVESTINKGSSFIITIPKNYF